MRARGGVGHAGDRVDLGEPAHAGGHGVDGDEGGAGEGQGDDPDEAGVVDGFGVADGDADVGGDPGERVPEGHGDADAGEGRSSTETFGGPRTARRAVSFSSIPSHLSQTGGRIDPSAEHGQTSFAHV